MPPQNNQPSPQTPPDNDLPQPPAPYPDPVPPAIPPLHPINNLPTVADNNEPKEEANRYAFFMESKPKTPKPSLVPSKTNKFAWIIIGAIVFLLILGGAAVILNNYQTKNATNTDSLTNVIKAQQEIIRVNNLAVKDVTSRDLSNFLATAVITTTSSQQATIDYVVKHGGKIDEEVLKNYKADPQTDKVLESAKAASVYESTYRRIMLEIVTAYQNRLERLSSTATLEAEKAVIDRDLNDAKLLRVMLEKS